MAMDPHAFSILFIPSMYNLHPNPDEEVSMQFLECAVSCKKRHSQIPLEWYYIGKCIDTASYSTVRYRKMTHK